MPHRSVRRECARKTSEPRVRREARKQRKIRGSERRRSPAEIEGGDVADGRWRDSFRDDLARSPNRDRVRVWRRRRRPGRQRQADAARGGRLTRIMSVAGMNMRRRHHHPQAHGGGQQQNIAAAHLARRPEEMCECPTHPCYYVAAGERSQAGNREGGDDRSTRSSAMPLQAAARARFARRRR